MKKKHDDTDNKAENLVKDLSRIGNSVSKPRRIKKLTLKEKIQNGAPDNEFMINEIVLATVTGFCAWPARIIL